MQLKLQPNRYLSDISLLSEEILGKIEVVNATASSRYDKQRRTRGEKVRIKFCRRMKFFLVEGGSCSYDDESIGDIDVPLRYKHLVKQWVPKELPPIDVHSLSTIGHIALHHPPCMAWGYFPWME
jgi:hypothetical protein